jgi:hypothetical protein
MCANKQKARVPVGSRAVSFDIENTIQKFKIKVKWLVAF